MNLFRTQYAYHLQRLEIYLSGCDGVCPHCHNKQAFNFNAGANITTSIMDMLILKAGQGLIKNVWILGGEPLLQDKQELYYFMSNLRRANTPIWLWTRFELEEVPDNILSVCDYIKTGRYQQELPSKEISSINLTLASNNQKLYKKENETWREIK